MPRVCFRRWPSSKVGWIVTRERETEAKKFLADSNGRNSLYEKKKPRPHVLLLEQLEWLVVCPSSTFPSMQQIQNMWDELDNGWQHLKIVSSMRVPEINTSPDGPRNIGRGILKPNWVIRLTTPTSTTINGFAL